MSESMQNILIASAVNLILIPILYYALIAKMKEIVHDAVEKLEKDFDEKLEIVRCDTIENQKEIAVLKSRHEGFDSWLKEVSERLDSGFRSLSEKLDRHITEHK